MINTVELKSESTEGVSKTDTKQDTIIVFNWLLVTFIIEVLSFSNNIVFHKNKVKNDEKNNFLSNEVAVVCKYWKQNI